MPLYLCNLTREFIPFFYYSFEPFDIGPTATFSEGNATHILVSVITDIVCSSLRDPHVVTRQARIGLRSFQYMLSASSFQTNREHGLAWHASLRDIAYTTSNRWHYCCGV